MNRAIFLALSRTGMGNTTIIGNPADYPDTDGTSDQHGGIDYEGLPGLWVLSPVNGMVLIAGTVSNSGANAVEVRAYPNSKTDDSTSFNLAMGHLREWLVETGDIVCRGQIIGTNGDTGSYPPHDHIHFACYDNGVWSENLPPAVIDPYRDLIENDFRYKTYQANNNRISIGSPGLWTKDNDPQHAY